MLLLDEPKRSIRGPPAHSTRPDPLHSQRGRENSVVQNEMLSTMHYYAANNQGTINATSANQQGRF